MPLIKILAYLPSFSAHGKFSRRSIEVMVSGLGQFKKHAGNVMLSLFAPMILFVSCLSAFNQSGLKLNDPTMACCWDMRGIVAKCKRSHFIVSLCIDKVSKIQSTVTGIMQPRPHDWCQETACVTSTVLYRVRQLA